MASSSCSTTAGPYKYVFHLKENVLTITATHIKNYFEWSLIVDSTYKHDFLTPRIIFDIFCDKNLPRKVNIIFPSPVESDQILSITIVTIISFYIHTLEKKEILNLEPQAITSIARTKKK